MPTEKKTRAVDSLQEAFTRSNVNILTHYQGLSTQELTVLRRRLQASNSECRVVKNTLARIAATRAGKDVLAASLEGPVAVVFGYGEVTAPARVVLGYINEANVGMSVKGGLLGTRLMTPDEVKILATLPAKDVLLARVLGQMKAPVAGLLGCLSAPMRGLAGVLQARIKQLEGN
ncbi:MAG: 50S ribosomal protein L10 [Chloroflexi bacterium]|nr:50S ribosomal protein L10 [Chloroflexota bacterium]